jgi:hypothetical protein
MLRLGFHFVRSGGLVPTSKSKVDLCQESCKDAFRYRLDDGQREDALLEGRLSSGRELPRVFIGSLA